MTELIAAWVTLIVLLFSGGHGGHANQSHNHQRNRPSSGPAAPALVITEEPAPNRQSQPTTIPTPALLPGLLGFGVAALRRRKAID